MNLRSVRTLFLSILFAALWLPGLVSAQEEPQVFLGFNITDDPIVVGDNDFLADIGWANGALGNWTHTELYFIDQDLTTQLGYSCFDQPVNHGGNTSGTEVGVALPVVGTPLTTPGTYNVFAFQAANSNCNDVGNSLAVGLCVVGGVFNVDLCPSDTLTVLAEADFTVSKDFSDDNPGDVDVAVTCSEFATITTDSSGTVSESADFVVSLQWDVADGTPTCSATETPVVGYTDDTGDACTDVDVTFADGGACTLVNTQNPVNVEITKAYTEAHPVDDSEAEITLTCPTATIEEATLTTVDGVATFVVSDFPYDGEDCVATESALPGYVQTDATGCDALTVIPTDDDPAASCTITNRPTEATFTVDKQFSDGNLVATTTAEVTCSDLGNGPGLILTGYPAASTGTIGENTDYVATVKWFDTTATCDATEIDLVGYTQDLDLSTCDDGVDVDDDTDNSCVIFNDQDPVFINADKIYSSGGGSAVDFAVECTNLDTGGTVTPSTDSASPGNPAVFEVNDFMWDGSTICNVTEPVAPGGYWETDNTCVDLSIVPSDDPVECGITNSPTRATFRVTKYFDDGNNVDEVEVSIDCNTGLILDQDKLLSDGEWVEFVVTDFTDGTLECTITEDGQSGYTGEYDNVTLGNIISAENCEYPAESITADTPAHECVITNYPDPVDIHINKEWVFNSFGATPDIDVYFELWLSCSAPIEFQNCYANLSPGGNVEGPLGHKGPKTPYENWAYCYGDANLFGDEEIYDADMHVTVVPEFPQTSCVAWERVYDDAIEVDNGCGSFNISVNNGYDCTITNTVFFEGIPTLSQYGLAIMALLMLGVGLVGFRRFS